MKIALGLGTLLSTETMIILTYIIATNFSIILSPYFFYLNLVYTINKSSYPLIICALNYKYLHNETRVSIEHTHWYTNHTYTQIQLP